MTDRYCPKCGATNICVDHVRYEGSFGDCWACGYSGWLRNFRKTPPKHPKPPCEHIEFYNQGRNDVYHSACGVSLGDCVHPLGDKTVSCFENNRTLSRFKHKKRLT